MIVIKANIQLAITEPTNNCDTCHQSYTTQFIMRFKYKNNYDDSYSFNNLSSINHIKICPVIRILSMANMI